MNNNEWIYMISEKSNSLIRLIISIIISVFAMVLSIDQLTGKQNKSQFLGIAFAALAMFSLTISARLIIRFIWFKLFIGEDKFFLQTNPFNKGEYYYSDVSNIRVEVKSSRAGFSHYVSQPVYMCYLCFEDIEGNTHKALIEKERYEKAIGYIIERINKQ